MAALGWSDYFHFIYQAQHDLMGHLRLVIEATLVAVSRVEPKALPALQSEKNIIGSKGCQIFHIHLLDCMRTCQFPGAADKNNVYVDAAILWRCFIEKHISGDDHHSCTRGFCALQG